MKSVKIISVLAVGVLAFAAIGMLQPRQKPTASPPTIAPRQKLANNPATNPLASRKTEPTDTDQKLSGVIIATSQPQAVKKAAEKRGLKVIRITHASKNKSYVVLAASPSDARVKSIQQQIPGASITKSRNYRAVYTFTNQDTNYTSQWNLAKISAPSAWDISTGSSDTTIAIIDTGVLSSQTINDTTYTQPDFPTSKIWQNAGESGATASEGSAPNCTSRSLSLDKSCNNLDDDGNGKIDDLQGWDFMGGYSGNGAQCPNHDASLAAGDYISEDNDPQPYSCDSTSSPSTLNKNQFDGTCVYDTSACFIGHGTMVGSVAASASNNGQLIAGVDHQAKVMPVRVLDGFGFTSSDRVAAAITYATENGADVINLSLAVSDCSSPSTDPTIESAMAAAKAAGVVVVAASGNEYIANVCYPASSSNAIAVGATNSSDQRADFSNYGSSLDIVAPGASVPVANAPSSAINSNYYSSASGTSFATPHVAGLAGLIKAVTPTASWDQIYSFLTTGTDKVSGMGGQNRTDMYGYGRINAVKTLQNALNSQYTWNVESNVLYTDASRLTQFSSVPTVAPSGSFYARVVGRNTGILGWDTSFMRIGTTQQRDRISQFAEGGWLAGNRPAAMTEASANPGSVGTFDFTLAAPATAGGYRECFNGVAESRRWLAGNDLCYVLNVVEAASPSTGNNTEMSPNETLYPGQYLLSADNQSTFTLQRDGNVVLYQNFKAVWNSGTAGKAANRLVMQTDGNLVLYSNNNTALWHSSTYGNNNSTLKLQTDGDLVLYSAVDTPLWSTDTAHVPNLLSYVNQSSTRAILLPGQKYETPNRQHRLVFQTDGNVVLYSAAGARWSSQTSGKPAKMLIMQSDGNFVLYDQNNKPLWHTRTGGNTNAYITVQADGNVVIYSAQGKALWHTKTYQ